jgi:mannan endo-1,4-beta-mannosidase
MMIRKQLFVGLIVIGAFFANSLHGQVTGLTEDFNDNTLSGGWANEFTSTYQLSEQDSVLKITYTRTASSDMWDQFNFSFVEVDASENPYISVDAKSDIETELTFKPENNQGGSDWQLRHTLPGDNQWHHYEFELLSSVNFPLVRIWMYLDAGSTTSKSGTVFLDNIKIGDEAIILADTSSLNDAIADGNLLISNSDIGSGQGEYPAGALTELESAIDSATNVYSSYAGQYSVPFIDSLIDYVYNACMIFESQVFSDDYSLIDSAATMPTRYLYQNLKTMANAKRFMFGMHDATGYGVGWSGDNHRSDVNDVCGSFPAVFSWDIAGVISGTWEELFDKMEYTYNMGGVQTMCWHQSDPLGRGFYQSDVNYPVVDSLLPGGAYHSFYKESLEKLSRFVKRARDTNGRAIPIIFRPYHEHNGSWFWWGKNNCSELEYQQLWQFTMHYLRDTLGVHNFIYTFSPDGHQYSPKSQYLYGYPGDDYVDILGLDFYFGGTAEVSKLGDRIQHIAEYSETKNKVAERHRGVHWLDGSCRIDLRFI